MILIDYREKAGRREKTEMVDLIRKIGVKAETADLTYGDACFEGKGPGGTILVGVERKRLHDMLQCIEDSRYNAHQRPGMARMYQMSYLLIEGIWRPHDPKGTLMEGNHQGQWWESRPYGRPVLYSKLRRYLFSLQLAGVHVLYTRDMQHSAYDLCELYHYFQKKWTNHTSLLEKQKLNIPALNGKPPLVQRWAAELDGVGVKLSGDVARRFKTPTALANSEELEWLTIPGIGEKRAADIVAQIEGKKV